MYLLSYRTYACKLSPPWRRPTPAKGSKRVGVSAHKLNQYIALFIFTHCISMFEWHFLSPCFLYVSDGCSHPVIYLFLINYNIFSYFDSTIISCNTKPLGVLFLFFTLIKGSPIQVLHHIYSIGGHSPDFFGPPGPSQPYHLKSYGWYMLRISLPFFSLIWTSLWHIAWRSWLLKSRPAQVECTLALRGERRGK